MKTIYNNLQGKELPDCYSLVDNNNDCIYRSYTAVIGDRPFPQRKPTNHGYISRFDSRIFKALQFRGSCDDSKYRDQYEHNPKGVMTRHISYYI